MTKSLSQNLLDNIATRSGTVVTQSEMVALKKRWSPWNRHHKDNRYAEAEKFASAAPFLVSVEQTAKGLKWWRSMVFLPSGAVRNTQFVRENLNEYRINVLRNFDRFEFVDWEWLGNAHIEHPFPMYRVIAKNGDTFTYTMRGWQSGGSICA